MAWTPRTPTPNGSGQTHFTNEEIEAWGWAAPNTEQRLGPGPFQLPGKPVSVCSWLWWLRCILGSTPPCRDHQPLLGQYKEAGKAGSG